MTAIQSFEADILRRVVEPHRAGWSREAAEALINLSFSEQDRNRATELAEKAGQDTLSDDEHREMAGFGHVGRFLELIKSRARLSLKPLAVA